MRKWLRDLRNEKGLTMKEIAEQLDISESYYCAIENGDRQKKMDITLVAALASVFDVPLAKVAQYETEHSKKASA